MLTATFEMQSVLIIGWVVGGHVVCSPQDSQVDGIQKAIYTEVIGCFVIPSRSSTGESRLYKIFKATDK